jgi:hypothetical protein
MNGGQNSLNTPLSFFNKEKNYKDLGTGDNLIKSAKILLLKSLKEKKNDYFRNFDRI